MNATLRPTTPITLSVAQMIAIGLAIGGVGFSVGALYPRLLAVETGVAAAASQLHELQSQQVATARSLERVTAIVERLEVRR